MNSSDVQVNINELLTAFSGEVATLVQRAIIAEQKAKALQTALDTAYQTIEQMRTAIPVAPEDTAVTEVKTTTRGRRT